MNKNKNDTERGCVKQVGGAETRQKWNWASDRCWARGALRIQLGSNLGR
jgi:hypothetical protein